MNINYRKYLTLCVGFATALLVACDPDGEQNFEFEPGSNLLISGPATVNFNDVLADGTASSYYVNGFTVEQEYTWTLDGNPVTPIRDGEYVQINFGELGTGDYELAVANDRGVSGTRTITVEADPREVSFANADMQEVAEDADTLWVPVVISGRGTASATTVSYEVTGTAVEGVDYELLSDNPLVIESGEIEGYVRFDILNNLAFSEDERTIGINILSVTSEDDGNTDLQSVLTDSVELTAYNTMILEDLKMLGFTEEATDLELTSAEAEAGVYEFPVGLSASAQAPVTVHYTVSGEGVNDLTGGSITLRSANDPQPITVEILEAAFGNGQDIRIEITDIESEDEEVVFETDEEGEPVNNVRVISVQ